jgi:hypothetical protein
VSPIFVRPVREQLEHDRLIRHLQATYAKKFEVTVNLGEEQASPVKIGANVFFPDLVLSDGHRLAGVVEVETGESVNNLEAMAQWVHFSRVRVPFHLYVPVQGYDAARRLCDALKVKASEIWSYRPDVEGFDLVRMFVEPRRARSAGSAKSGVSRGAAPGKRVGSPKAKVAKRAKAPAARKSKPAASTKAGRSRRPAVRPAKSARVVRPSTGGGKAKAAGRVRAVAPGTTRKPAARKRASGHKR